jgi:DNA mismatch repair protein MSH6
MLMLFYSYREHWTNALNCVAELDALCSIALYSKGKCKPKFLKECSATLKIKLLQHPYLPDYIPNDVIMDRYKCILVTGANMGGKSTLLRLVCQAVILAQIGAFVPAQEY